MFCEPGECDRLGERDNMVDWSKTERCEGCWADMSSGSLCCGDDFAGAGTHALLLTLGRETRAGLAVPRPDRLKALFPFPSDDFLKAAYWSFWSSGTTAGDTPAVERMLLEGGEKMFFDAVRYELSSAWKAK